MGRHVYVRVCVPCVSFALPPPSLSFLTWSTSSTDAKRRRGAALFFRQRHDRGVLRDFREALLQREHAGDAGDRQRRDLLRRDRGT